MKDPCPNKDLGTQGNDYKKGRNNVLKESNM